ncbi:MAG: dodecin family protein [Bacillota bacterium]
MAIVKVIEVIAESPISWEEATQEAIKQASKSVNNIQSIYIKEFKASVAGDKVNKYLVNAKISFIVED